MFFFTRMGISAVGMMSSKKPKKKKKKKYLKITALLTMYWVTLGELLDSFIK